MIGERRQRTADGRRDGASSYVRAGKPALETRRNTRCQTVEQRRENHGADGDRNEGLAKLRVEQAGLGTNLRQHKREFADLRRQDARHERDTKRMAKHHHDARRDERLEHDDGEEDAEDDHGVGEHASHVEQHPDRDEEQRVEHFAQRQHFAERLMSVLRLGKNETGDERAESHRQSDLRGRDCHSEAEQDDREEKDFPLARRDDHLKEPRHEPARRRYRERDEKSGLHDDDEKVLHVAAGATEERRDEHHWDDDEILEDQDADRRTSMRRVELVAIGEHANHDRGAAQRDEHSEEDGDRQAQSERGRGRRRRTERQRNLERPAGEEKRADTRQLLDRELDADGEQEEDDADFRQRLDVLDTIDETESERAAEQPSDEESDDRRQPRAMERDDDDDAEAEDEEEILEEMRLGQCGR